MFTSSYLLNKAPLLITWFSDFAAWRISASALNSQVLMSANEWEVNLWPHLFDCAVASPPSAPCFTARWVFPCGLAVSRCLSRCFKGEGANSLTFLLSGDSCSCFIWSHQAESPQKRPPRKPFVIIMNFYSNLYCWTPQQNFAFFCVSKFKPRFLFFLNHFFPFCILSVYTGCYVPTNTV